MKRGVTARATTMQLEHAAGYDRAIVETAAGPTRRGRCRVGSDRQPVRHGLRRDRHLRRGHCRDTLGPVGRRLAPQRPRRPAGRGARREFSASRRRPSLRPVRRSGCRHRPCLARLAADAGHALPRHLPDRAPHGHQWNVGRPMVLGRCRAAGDEPRRAATADEDLEPCRPAGRGGGNCRRRTGVATPAAQHERDPRRPAHLRRLRRRRGPPAAAVHGTCHSWFDRRAGARRARPWNRHRHRGVALDERASAGRDVEQAQSPSGRRAALPRRVRHASRHPSGKPHRRSHLPERDRPPAARLAVDRQEPSRTGCWAH